jgi:hypothetical protein
MVDVKTTRAANVNGEPEGVSHTAAISPQNELRNVSRNAACRWLAGDRLTPESCLAPNRPRTLHNRNSNPTDVAPSGSVR